jgi:predicted DCC family thiol-disulfide oxidoreductase YuxK
VPFTDNASTVSPLTPKGTESLADPALKARTLVLYDGVCGLCNRLVYFLLRHDQLDRLRFASLQSEFAQLRLQHHGLNNRDFDSVVVLADFDQPNQRVLVRSAAVLETFEQLGGVWKALARLAARLIPESIREALYRAIAKRRYKIFGKYDECPAPRPQDRHKFL